MCSNESKPLEVIQIIKYNWLKINVMKIKLERQETLIYRVKGRETKNTMIKRIGADVSLRFLDSKKL